MRTHNRPPRPLVAHTADRPVVRCRESQAEVRHRRTLYEMSCGSIDLSLTFFTAQLPSNLTLMARPVSCLTVTSSSKDAGNPSGLRLYVDVSAQAACAGRTHRCRKTSRPWHPAPEASGKGSTMLGSATRLPRVILFRVQLAPARTSAVPGITSIGANSTSQAKARSVCFPPTRAGRRSLHRASWRHPSRGRR